MTELQYPTLVGGPLDGAMSPIYPQPGRTYAFPARKVLDITLHATEKAPKLEFWSWQLAEKGRSTPFDFNSALQGGEFRYVPRT